MTSDKNIEDLLCKYVNKDNIPERTQVLDALIERLSGNAVISYAQNYEDIILRRIFGESAGTYIDVGAFDPYLKSVTCMFWQKGWSGINIDVSEENIDKFNQLRPNDINICAAIGYGSEEEEFFMLSGTTRSTKLQELGKDYENRGKVVERKVKKITPLTNILKNHNISDIDILNIDVEGAEKEVLLGLDFNQYMPKVILAEATYPETTRPNWNEWESILTDVGYQCVYFDGLNRFYCHEDDPKFKEILEVLNVPPNYFDDFVRYDYILSVLAK